MTKFQLVQGDITEQVVDAIVNAANSGLGGGGGVDGAIHRAGGPSIRLACKELRATTFKRGLPAGKAAATTAGNLDARWVIHTVGPFYDRATDQSTVLASAYRESLRVADELGATSVAFPAISAGAYGWPVHDAARIALESITDVETTVSDIRFVLFSDKDFQAFTKAANQLRLTTK